MELRQLEYFLMVSKLNSFTRAAEKLYVSQPTVTSAIRSLEEELGIQLFDRSQKYIILTMEGRVFLKHVEHVMQDVSKTILEMNELKNLSRGTIKIIVPPIISGSLFPPIYVQFKQEYPSLEFIVMEKGSLIAKTMVEQNEADLAFVVSGEQDDLLDVTPVFEQELVACLPLGHHLAVRKRVKISDIQAESFVLIGEDCAARHRIMQELICYTDNPNIVHSSDHIQSIISLVAAGAGLSVLPQACAGCDRRIAWVPFDPPFILSIGIARKKDKYLSNAAQSFLNYVRTCRK